MRFIKVVDWQPGIIALGERLHTALKAHNNVLWLVSGGSNIQASVSVMDNIAEELTEHLTIMLIDERFGLPGHKDSNYKQFQDAGFNPRQATFMPMLVEGLNLQETAHRYEELLERALESADMVVSQLGIGSDGHIAGILPRTSAVNADGLVTAYKHPSYTRITATFEALKRIDCDYSFVFGKDKQDALTTLKTEVLTLEVQPSQILKQLPEAYIYNDQIGG